MPDPEYVRIKISDIPAEFIEEYNLTGVGGVGPTVPVAAACPC